MDESDNIFQQIFENGIQIEKDIDNNKIYNSANDKTQLQSNGNIGNQPPKEQTPKKTMPKRNNEALKQNPQTPKKKVGRGNIGNQPPKEQTPKKTIPKGNNEALKQSPQTPKKKVGRGNIGSQPPKEQTPKKTNLNDNTEDSNIFNAIQQKIHRNQMGKRKEVNNSNMPIEPRTHKNENSSVLDVNENRTPQVHKYGHQKRNGNGIMSDIKPRVKPISVSMSNKCSDNIMGPYVFSYLRISEFTRNEESPFKVEGNNVTAIAPSDSKFNIEFSEKTYSFSQIFVEKNEFNPLVNFQNVFNDNVSADINQLFISYGAEKTGKTIVLNKIMQNLVKKLESKLSNEQNGIIFISSFYVSDDEIINSRNNMRINLNDLHNVILNNTEKISELNEIQNNFLKIEKNKKSHHLVFTVIYRYLEQTRMFSFVELRGNNNNNNLAPQEFGSLIGKMINLYPVKDSQFNNIIIANLLSCYFKQNSKQNKIFVIINISSLAEKFDQSINSMQLLSENEDQVNVFDFNDDKEDKEFDENEKILNGYKEIKILLPENILKYQLSNVNTKLSNIVEEINKLYSKLSEVQKANEEKSEMLNDKKNELKEKSENYQKCKEEIENVKKKYNAIQTKINEMKNKHNEKIKIIEEKMEKIHDLKNKLK